MVKYGDVDTQDDDDDEFEKNDRATAQKLVHEYVHWPCYSSWLSFFLLPAQFHPVVPQIRRRAVPSSTGRECCDDSSLLSS